MDFDDYWENLINRVYHKRERLIGNEDIFYRLSCIYGENMVDGIESYFERRCDEFTADMEALRKSGFDELVFEFECARNLLFDSKPLNRKIVEPIILKLLDETEESEPVIKEIGKIYDRIIPQLQILSDYNYSFGLEKGLFHKI
jgi:hypothetical protein